MCIRDSKQGVLGPQAVPAGVQHLQVAQVVEGAQHRGKEGEHQEGQPHRGAAALHQDVYKRQTQDGEEQEELSSGDSLKLDLYFWLQALVLALVALILLFTFVGRIIGVDGSSMYPTLHHGDMLLLQSVGYEPKQGDVVVLTKAFRDVDGPIVKRVIAVGGQTVDIDYDAGTVAVDGQVLDEPYINEAMLCPTSVSYTHLAAGAVGPVGGGQPHRPVPAHPAERGAGGGRAGAGRPLRAGGPGEWGGSLPMKILKMRATFGKLQSAELALGEGLNVIEAPNEGGKSTWSAFLRAMLYGINTKERDRQGYLAEKNRYQPCLLYTSRCV